MESINKVVMCISMVLTAYMSVAKRIEFFRSCKNAKRQSNRLQINVPSNIIRDIFVLSQSHFYAKFVLI